jgi:acetylornithine deacetylase/succinyl-diaminopimelate desuccinylase-like protein
MDTGAARKLIDHAWANSIVPELVAYIRIPNKSPMFDPHWVENGYMEKATAQFEAWARAQVIAGLSVEVVRLPQRTPLLYMEIPGSGGDNRTVLLYGHLDKQPEMSGWRAELGPWQPVIEGERLYGRGGADDGYAMFASLTALRVLTAQGLPHARCVVIIEACEESGSYDLPFYIDALRERIGTPELVICLDSGCGNYEQLWATTSLRGLVGGNLNVSILNEGVHSGDASGIVPSSFRIVRQLLSRLEDQISGAIIPAEFHAAIPLQRLRQARCAAQVLGENCYVRFPFINGAEPISADAGTLILNRTWRPALEVTGAGSLPPLDNAGNVMRPVTSLKLSLRLPPSVDADQATQTLKVLLESDPPYGAKVSFEPEWGATGWNAPPTAEWLENSLQSASRAFFGQPAMYMGEGGTIPFMGMLGAEFPRAQFLITGVLGPEANAHGPNEFLHLPTARRLTGCVAQVIADHYLT